MLVDVKVPVHKSSAHLELLAPCFGRPCTTTNAVTSFEKQNTQVAIKGEIPCGNKTTEARANHNHIIRALCVHSACNDSICSQTFVYTGVVILMTFLCVSHDPDGQEEFVGTDDDTKTHD